MESQPGMTTREVFAELAEVVQDRKWVEKQESPAVCKQSKMAAWSKRKGTTSKAPGSRDGLKDETDDPDPSRGSSLQRGFFGSFS